MSFCNTRHIKSSRKASRCYWCAELIKVGDPKTTVSHINEGDFFHTRFHPECEVVVREWQKKNNDEEYWPDCGEMRRGSTEPKFNIE